MMRHTSVMLTQPWLQTLSPAGIEVLGKKFGFLLEPTSMDRKSCALPKQME
jgi:hypothetical protein